MPDLFLELFSEEIPSNLQKNARNNLLQNFKDFFEQEKIIHKSEGKVFSTPNRLIILFDRIDTEIHRKSEYIRGPNINAPEKALDGFIKSNKIEKKNIFEKQTEKGKFYFFKKPAKKIQNRKTCFSLLQYPIAQSPQSGNEPVYCGAGICFYFHC